MSQFHQDGDQPRLSPSGCRYFETCACHSCRGGFPLSRVHGSVPLPPSLSFSAPMSPSLKAPSLADVLISARHKAAGRSEGKSGQLYCGSYWNQDWPVSPINFRGFFFPLPSLPSSPARFNCAISRPYGSNITQWVTLGDISEIAQGENNGGNVYPEPQKLRADAGIHYGP